MKCSYQSVYKFNQASLQNESGYETGRFVHVRGGERHKSYRFNKVREMINNLITHLKEEASEDAEHKGLV